MRRILVLATVLLAALAASAAAVGPAPGETAVLRDGETLYTARVANFDTTVKNGAAQHRLAGEWGFPRVAFDGSTGGLSVDGGTLVLAQMTHGQPASPTKFAVLAPRTLQVRRIVSLPGQFAFDALSPNGKRMYLIQYVTVVGQLRYRVRAYDLQSGRLLKRVIADKRSGWTAMEGMPLARATGDGGSWVYTLYGSETKTFVHALNAAQGYALCIDLPLGPQTVSRLRLDGGRLSVVDRGGTERAAIDTASLQVVRS
jgi:hypothetical protein